MKEKDTPALSLVILQKSLLKGDPQAQLFGEVHSTRYFLCGISMCQVLRAPEAVSQRSHVMFMQISESHQR